MSNQSNNELRTSASGEENTTEQKSVIEEDEKLNSELRLNLEESNSSEKNENINQDPPPLRTPHFNNDLLSALELNQLLEESNISLDNYQKLLDFNFNFDNTLQFPDLEASLNQNNNNFNFNNNNNNNNNNYLENEQLLPPLRRPQLNNFPADILAILLKNRRFEDTIFNRNNSYPQEPDYNYSQQQQQPQITPVPNNQQYLNKNRRDNSPLYQDQHQQQQQQHHHQQQQSHQQQQQQHHHHQQQQQHHHQQQQQQKNHQRQQYPSTSSNNNYTNKVPKETFQSKFNPFAAEFVPSSSYNAHGMSNSKMNKSDEKGNNFASQFEDESNFYLNSNDSADIILTVVTDTINQLTGNPADFDRCSKATNDAFIKHLNDPDTLGIVVTLIIEQAISNSNFCYSAARLCQYFIKNNVSASDQATFKSTLLNRCHEEFMRSLDNVKQRQDQNRALGLLYFLGELFMNIRIEVKAANGQVNSQPIFLLGLATAELMNTLMSNNPNYDVTKKVYQLLKLLGWEFENSNDPKLKIEMENLMKEVSHLIVMKNLDSSTQNILEALVNLKKRDWDHYSTNEESIISSYMTDGQKPIFYELPESVEEDYEGEILMDDEPEEVLEAYEEFLKSTALKKNSNNAKKQ